MDTELLKPAVALVAWTLAMLTWGVAMRVAGGKDVDPTIAKRMVEAGKVLPTTSQFKIDNYNHLVEQPTLFYAITLILALLGGGSAINIVLAWSYVGLRIIHSLVHATSNPVMLRFAIFTVASIVLIWITVNTVLLVF